MKLPVFRSFQPSKGCHGSIMSVNLKDILNEFVTANDERRKHFELNE